MKSKLLETYYFDVEGIGEVKGELLQQMSDSLEKPYYWRTSMEYDRHVEYFHARDDMARAALFDYIDKFDPETKKQNKW